MASAPQASSDEIGKYYDRFTDLFTDIWDGNLHVGYWHDERDPATLGAATEQLTRQLIGRLDPRPGQRVLDVGCGVGQPAITLARAHEVRVVGVSISRHQVGRATERAAGAELADRVRFAYADAAALPFDDASFDAAWAVESLLHMPDKVQVLREIARVLRPGSRLVLADMFQQPGSELAYRGMITAIGFDAYRGLLEGTGFTPLDITDVTARTRGTDSSRREMRAKLEEHRDEAVQIMGEEMFNQTMETDSVPPEYGYALVTAVRA
ncbi:SAM-dependent methyltransferase [Streptomyces sp. NPDC055078]